MAELWLESVDTLRAPEWESVCDRSNDKAGDLAKTIALVVTSYLLSVGALALATQMEIVSRITLVH